LSLITFKGDSSGDFRLRYHQSRCFLQGCTPRSLPNEPRPVAAVRIGEYGKWGIPCSPTDYVHSTINSRLFKSLALRGHHDWPVKGVIRPESRGAAAKSLVTDRGLSIAQRRANFRWRQRRNRRTDHK
jgi:hypothetical protein